MKQARRLFAVAAALVLMTAISFGQAAAKKKTYTFRGKVEAINEKAKSLTVNGEDVPGWMGAMTMDYQVEDAAVLKKVKVGDQISSTVYDGDYVLHKVEIVAKAAAPAKSEKKNEVMNQVFTSAMTGGRKWTALMLLVLSLLIPVAPALQAAVRSQPEDCECCRRAAKKCDPKSHRRSPAGPAWNASPECGKQCAQPDSAPSPIVIYSAERTVMPYPHSAPDDVPVIRQNHSSSSYSAWLYQRPPPRA